MDQRHYQGLLKDCKKDDDNIKDQTEDLGDVQTHSKDDEESTKDKLRQNKGTDIEENKECISLQYNDKPPRLSVKLKNIQDRPTLREWKPWSDAELPIDLLLLTVEDCEFLSCLNYLDKPFKSYNLNAGVVYFGSMGSGGQDKLKIALMKSFKGSLLGPESVTLLMSAVTVLRPKALFSVGACIGLNSEETKQGDVVVSSTLTTSVFKLTVSRNIDELFEHVANRWKPPLEDPEMLKLRVHCGDMLSLAQASIFGWRYEDIIQRYPEATAFETQGEDVLAVARMEQIEWVIVKGVAGYGNLCQPSSEDWMLFASTMAASLVAEVLCDPVNQEKIKQWKPSRTTKTSTNEKHGEMKDRTQEDRNQKTEDNAKPKDTYKGGHFIPAYVRARGEKALAAYHRALASGRTYDKRVKVLLVGQDRVGKTSLSKSLRGEPFNIAEPSTEGVQMIAPVKNAGSDAWRNPTYLEHTTVFDHTISATVAKELLSTHAELSSESLTETDETGDQGTPTVASKKTFQQSRLTKEHGLQCAHPENIQKDNLEEKVKQIQQGPFRVTPMDEGQERILDEDPIPQETAFLIEENLKENEVNQDDRIWPVIWDFAGQDIYRAIHPIFMSSEDIYLLVFDLTKKLTSLAECQVNLRNKEYTARARESEDTNLDHLLRWMDLIHSLSHQNEGSSPEFSHPPVIIVGTHADCVEPSKEIEIVREKCSRVLKVFSEHIVKCLPVDNTKAGKTTDQVKIVTLRNAILDLAQKMPHTKKEIPLQWHRVEKEISKLTWKDKKYLQKKIFHEEIVSRYCRFDNEDDVDELLHFLHARGSIVYHKCTGDDDGLVVLDPQWLINVLCEIVKVTPYDDEVLSLSQDRTDLRENGILRRRLLNYACKNQNLDPIKDSLISLMEKFNLICTWPTTKTEDSIILVPCMLTARREEVETVDQVISSAPSPIYLTFDETYYVPDGLFCRLVVLFGKWLSRPQCTHEYSLHANEARFALDQDGNFLILVCYKTVIKVHIKGPADSIPFNHCEDVLRHLMKFLETLRQECHWLKSMSTEVCALCTICFGKRDGNSKPCERHDEDETPCQRHDCAHYIPLKSKVICCRPGHPLPLDSLRPWIQALGNLKAAGKPDENQISDVELKRRSSSGRSTTTTFKRKQTAAAGTSVKKKRSFVNLKRTSPRFSTSTRKRKKRGAAVLKEGEPSWDELEELSEKLGLSWEKLARRLGFDDAEITGFCKNNEEYSKKALTMLFQWKKREGCDATYSVLYDSLSHNLVQRKDLADNLCCDQRFQHSLPTSFKRR